MGEPITTNEPLHKPDMIPNWENILGVNNRQRVYLVPRASGQTSLLVRDAVFKSLAGTKKYDDDVYEQFKRRRQRRNEDIEIDESEEEPVSFQTIQNQLNFDLDSSKYSDEADEARKQKKQVSNILTEYSNKFEPNLPLWQNGFELRHPKVDPMSLSYPNNAFENFLVLKAPVARLADRTGFPEKLIQKKWSVNAEDYEEGSETNASSEAFNAMAKLGYTKDQLKKDMLISQTDIIFRRILGFEEVERMQSEYGMPSHITNRDEYLAQVLDFYKSIYGNLTEEQKAQIRQTQTGTVINSLQKPVDVDGRIVAHENIQFSISGVDAQFNEEKCQVEADLDKGSNYDIRIDLDPVINGQTRHDELFKAYQITSNSLTNAGI